MGKKILDDIQIELAEPIFTHGEAVKMTKVSSKALNNYTQRGLLSLGEMHRTGRRLYSPLDLIELTILGQLIKDIGMKPSEAVQLASYAGRRAFEMTAKNDDGSLFCGETKESCVIGWRDGDEYYTAIMKIDEVKIPNDNIVIMIPMDGIIIRTLKQCITLLEKI